MNTFINNDRQFSGQAIAIVPEIGRISQAIGQLLIGLLILIIIGLAVLTA